MNIDDIDSIALRVKNPQETDIRVGKVRIESGEDDIKVGTLQQTRNRRRAKAKGLEPVGLVVGGELVHRFDEEEPEEEDDGLDALFGEVLLEDVDFESLTGVGESTAEDIDDYLAEHDLETAEELEAHGLTELPGIGESTVDELKKLLE